MARLGVYALLACTMWTSQPASAQGEFQIVWVNVGEAATENVSGAARAGKRLFAGAELAKLSLENVRVARIDAAPVVTEIALGQQWCLSALDVRAFDAEQELVPAAPLSVTVRQDQRPRLQMKRTARDLCVRPSEPGEYPLRLTSVLPAPDGSIRGAQIFLRVIGAAPTPQTAAEQ